MADFGSEHKILNNLLIIGCGDIGRRVAAHYRRQALTVTALARSAESAQSLAALGLEVCLGDLDRPQLLPPLPCQDGLLFYFAPPPAQGDGDPRLSALLHRLAVAPPRKIVYISTSGVYGDRGGNWVTEATPPQPGTQRAHRRLAAEEALQAWAAGSGRPVAILRVGGIYGPGRLPLERLRQGLPVLREEDGGYTNRIHADDLAAACIAAAAQGEGIYNVSDGRPSTMTDYFNRVADRYHLPRPPQISLAEARTRLSAEMLSYLEESRRLDNGKMLRELGITLRYPTLTEGLAAIAVEQADGAKKAMTSQQRKP